MFFEDLYKDLCIEWSDNKHLFKIKLIILNRTKMLTFVRLNDVRGYGYYLKRRYSYSYRVYGKGIEMRWLIFDHTVAKTKVEIYR